MSTVEQKGFLGKVLDFVAGRARLTYLVPQFPMSYVVCSRARPIATRDTFEKTFDTLTHISLSPALGLMLINSWAQLLVVEMTIHFIIIYMLAPKLFSSKL